jgi:hypothetical protein
VELQKEIELLRKQIQKLEEKLNEQKAKSNVPFTPPEAKAKPTGSGWQVVPAPGKQPKPAIAPQPLQPGVQPPRGNVDKKLEHILKELEELRRAMKGPKDLPGKRVEIKLDKHDGKPLQFQWQIAQPGTIRPAQPPTPPALPPKPGQPTGNLENKIDLLLKGMEELRRDVKMLKDALGGKQKTTLNDLKPLEKKPLTLQEAEAVGQLEKARKFLENMLEKEAAKAKPVDRQKALEHLQRANQPPGGSANMEKMLERIFQEVEALRREVDQMKSKK